MAVTPNQAGGIDAQNTTLEYQLQKQAAEMLDAVIAMRRQFVTGEDL